MTMDPASDPSTPSPADPSDDEPRPRGGLLRFLPVLIFVLLAAGGYWALELRSTGAISNDVPSVLIGKPVPEFDLPALSGLVRDGKPVEGITIADLNGKGVRLVNVFQSSCIPCRREHPILMKLAEDPRLAIFGLNYKDDPEDGRKFLGQLGNPYDKVGGDRRGRISIEWGVYGVPETFVVADGRILAKIIGELTPGRVRTELMPVVEKALAQGTGKGG